MTVESTTIKVDPPATPRPKPSTPGHRHHWHFGAAHREMGHWFVLMYCECGELKATGVTG